MVRFSDVLDLFIQPVQAGLVAFKLGSSTSMAEKAEIYKAWAQPWKAPVVEWVMATRRTPGTLR
jgi:hypothetical protein